MNRRARDLLPIGLIVLLAFPILPGTDGLLGGAAQAAVFVIIAASLVMLTGWVGQISLAHGAFVGVGAFATGWASTALGLGFPLSLPVAALVAGATAALLGAVALRIRGLYLAVATLIFSWAASEFLFRQSWLLQYGNIDVQTIGQPGMVFYLDFGSRTTFYYVAWATALAVVFGLTNLRDSKTGRAFFSIRGSEMAAASLGMDVLRYKSLSFALSGALAGVAGNLMISHTLVVSPDAFDFNASLFYLAIAVVGGLASLPGAVAAAFLFAAMNEVFFRVAFLNEYLQLVSTGLLAVVFLAYPGGLAAMGKQLAARSVDARRILFDRLPALVQGRISDARLRTSADAVGAATAGDGSSGPRRLLASRVDVLLTKLGSFTRRAGGARGAATVRVLDLDLALAASGALAGVEVEPEPDEAGVSAFELEDETFDEDDEPDLEVPEPAAAGATFTVIARRLAGQPGPDPARRHERTPLVEADGITVRFGGLTAVNDASLSVREGEIVGLIGPNGAGKTTLFNSIAGFNTPTEGRVRLFGDDVTEMPVYRRAQLGVARTFQLIQLFSQLTVFDNLLAATHLQNPTGFVQHIAVTSRALGSEMAARARVRRVIELLELEEVADRPVAGLPFGILRMVEVARALVSGAPVIMLDEPASGLDERETDRLTDVLRFVRGLGATLLLIEHDVRMVTAVTDYMYVLDRGTLIAEGSPADIQSNPEVIAAYLGQAEGTAEEPAHEPVEVS